MVQQPGLRELTKKSYLDLLENEVQVDAAAVAQFRKALEGEKHSEEKRLQAEEKEIKKRLDDARGKLKAMDRSGAPAEEDAKTTDRRKLHCEILRLERDLSLKRTERERGLPIAYENRIAKAELVEHWPGKRAEIREAVRSGRARARKFGDVADIGVREISQDQAKDIKLGQDVIREMKVYELMPPNWQDDKVREYVEKLAQEIAGRSDLRVPLNLTLLHSQEINAFMLPGGYLFVNTGPLEKAETESELAGVIAHEISHAAARHGHRLMKRATIANIAYQAAQVATLIFTGGAAGVGTYYALPCGFYGLGIVLELTLLGVSRQFEEEADQLGAQHAWRAGTTRTGSSHSSTRWLPKKAMSGQSVSSAHIRLFTSAPEIRFNQVPGYETATEGRSQAGPRRPKETAEAAALSGV